MAKGIFAGLLLGAAAAGAGYVTYKKLTPEQQADLRAKVDGVVDNARSWAEPHVQTAQEKATDLLDKADSFIDEKGYGDTKEQALEKMEDLMDKMKDKSDQLRAKYDDLKAQARDKVAPDLNDDINIVMDEDSEQSLSDALDEIYGKDENDEAAAFGDPEPVAVEEPHRVDQAVEDVKDDLQEKVDDVVDDVKEEKEDDIKPFTSDFSH